MVAHEETLNEWKQNLKEMLKIEQSFSYLNWKTIFMKSKRECTQE